jgi:anti-sigma factor RsiW
VTSVHHADDLALYAEGDLDPADARVLEAHLRDCSACRGFLDELRASQRALKDLAGETLDEGAMDALRARIVAARLREPARPSTASRLAVAASLAAALAAASWLAVPSVRVRHTSSQTLPPSPLPLPPSNEPGPERTAPAPLAPEPARRTAVRAPRAVVPKLSPEDADQLARAVVAVSRIQSVGQALREAPSPYPPMPLVRLATADPNVVIYWRVDPNGGD